MGDLCATNGGNEEIFIFRFGNSKKTVQLTQQQVDDIPYLANLINHRNFFSSIQNENGEYILNARIRYNWFLPIFQWIITGHPSVLFTKLSEEAYVFSMLRLYDYLCINPIAVPLLQGKHLVQLHSKEIVKKNFRFKYIRAKNLSEVRDTAVQFIIALSKNEYDLNDFNTRCSIFSLIMIILSHPNVFHFRLCHHTLILTKKICFSFFSYSQQRQLQQMEQSIQSIKHHSFDFVSDDEESLPHNFQNAFAWKDVYVPIEENKKLKDQEDFFKLRFRFSTYRFHIYDTIGCLSSFFPPLNIYRLSYIQPQRHIEECILEDVTGNLMPYEERRRWLKFRSSINRYIPPGLLCVIRSPELFINSRDLLIYQIKQTLKQNEARSARSGDFNTLPKQPKIDKFKHRCGPKAQKYR